MNGKGNAAGKAPGKAPGKVPGKALAGNGKAAAPHPEAGLQVASPIGDERLLSSTEDPQLSAVVNDNDARLWYITKYGQDKFGEEQLKVLVELRNKLRRDPACAVGVAEEVGYRKATMSAAEFLGDRQPEAIRLYASVQGKQAWSPLTKWLCWLAIVLVLALFSNGYETMVGSQIQKMKQNRSEYIETRTGLEAADGKLATGLSVMCEAGHRYRTAATQLVMLLGPLKPGPLEGASTAVPEVCTIAPTAIQDPQKRADSGTRTVETARRAEFAPTAFRAVLLRAELVDSFFTLFVLPMLYALLGALTSAMRAANAEFKAMTLTRIDAISLGARVLLGVVGGATIGILFRADTLDGAAGLTVLGLAFAIGYAVDLFFNMLDSVRFGLGGARNASPQKA